MTPFLNYTTWEYVMITIKNICIEDIENQIM